MTNKTFKLETLTCPSCVIKIEKGVKSTFGVENVEVLFNASKVKVTFDENSTDENEIKGVIKDLGFDVLGIK
ncbi:heavy-metal-associated domain-containing protein [Senegalia massiliensis]|uniref:Copper chaperone n=1 Tax=Senegalia massiliensis TaxID=1720316 RepID=A0A845R1R6_9CLOT|nr:heavy-metal-associated domain-containing protein [Senegalia massiliensis]NBI08204.1 copper chaperone [Senegalia massiliensis]